MTVFLICCWFLVSVTNGDTLFNGDKPRVLTSGIGPYELGTIFYTQVAGSVTSVLYYRTSEIAAVPRSCALFHFNGTLFAQADMTNETTSQTPAEGWQRCDFASPVSLVPMDLYIAMYRTDHFVYSTDFWSVYGFDSGVLVAIYARYSVYVGAAAFTFPPHPAPNNYWVDVIFKQETLSLPTAEPTSPGLTTAQTTATVAASTSMMSLAESTSSTNLSGQMSSDAATLPASGGSNSGGNDLVLIGILVGVALFVQCIILGVAIVLFVKWKRLRSTTPSETDDIAAEAMPATAAVYADASEVRSSSTNGNGSAVSIRTHEYGSAMGIH
jgi:hypothetical protein